MLDPHQLLMPTLFMGGTVPAALLKSPSRSEGGGKMTHSFRICDLLHSPDDQNTSKDSEISNESHSPFRGSSPNRDSRSTSPDAPSGSKKARKARTIFTDKQLQELESTFEKQKYLSVQDRMDLAHRMGLSDTQVKTWYQNRRTKWKRQASTGVDLLSDANNWAAVQHLIRTNPYWSNYLAANSISTPLATPVPLVMGLMPAFPQFLPTPSSPKE